MKMNVPFYFKQKRSEIVVLSALINCPALSQQLDNL